MRAFLVPIFFSVFLVACESGSKPEAALSPAPTSTEALIRVLDGLAAQDADAVVALVDGGPKAQDFFVSMIETFEAAEAFETKFREAYGDQAWEAFQAPLTAEERRPDANLKMADLPALRSAAEQWEGSEENGGRFEGLPRLPLPFKEVAGGWVVDGAHILPSEEALQGFTDTQRAMTSTVQRYMKAIGHEGISAEDIDYQLGKEFLLLIMGGEFKSDGKPAYPDRFRVDEL